MKRIEGRIHTPKFTDKIKKKLIEKMRGHCVDYEYNKDIVVGVCEEVYEKDGDIYGRFLIDNELVEEILDSGNFGYSIAFLKLTDKEGNTKNVELRQITILPNEMIPTPECRECKIKGDKDGTVSP